LQITPDLRLKQEVMIHSLPGILVVLS